MSTIADMKAEVAVQHWASMKKFIEHHMTELRENQMVHKNVTQRALALEEPWYKSVLETTKILHKMVCDEEVNARKEKAIVNKFTTIQ
jgi:hypothetical protein